MSYQFLPADRVRPGDVLRDSGLVTANLSTAAILNTLITAHGPVLLQAHDQVEVLRCL